MPLYRTSSGEFIDVAEGASPEVLRKLGVPRAAIREAIGGTGSGNTRPQTASDSRIARKQRTYEQGVEVNTAFGKSNIGKYTLTDRLVGDMTFGLSDKVNAGIAAAFDPNLSYSETSKALEGARNAQQSKSPYLSAGATVGGALLNPFTTGTTALRMAATGANALRAGGAADKLTRAAARIDRLGPVAKGTLAGANYGALDSALRSDRLQDVPGNALKGGAVGAMFGATFGGALYGAGRGVQIIRDRLSANAERTAASRVDELLDGRMTPEQAEGRLRTSNQSGGDGMVMDLTPGLRAEAGSLSRNTAVHASDDLISRGEARIQARPVRFADQVRKESGIDQYADDTIAGVVAGRKAQGKADYAPGGVMDKPLKWDDDLDEFFRNAPEATQLAIKRAYTQMLNRREVPAHASIGPNGSFTHIPNLRTLDYVKRGFDTEIGIALKVPDTTTAQALSAELSTLKGLLANANPRYAKLLATQRDAYQKQFALEIGKKSLRRLQSDPRGLMKELNALQPHQIQESRIGIIDALVQLDRKDAVKVFQNLNRSADQRAVIEFAFGSKRKARRIINWANTETKAAKTDALTAPGRQADEARVQFADKEHGGLGDVIFSTLRGQAFGGTMGGISGGVRTLQELSSGSYRNKLAQEEIAKILMSSGEGLAKKLGTVVAFKATRKAGNERRAIQAGKVGALAGTDLVR